jgi:hypothetical protein
MIKPIYSILSQNGAHTEEKNAIFSTERKFFPASFYEFFQSLVKFLLSGNKVFSIVTVDFLPVFYVH